MTDLESRCRTALTALLDRIPHDQDCASVAGIEGEYHLLLGACSCDRETRLVEALGAALARAIDATFYFHTLSDAARNIHDDAALAAFGRQENP